MNRKQIIRNLRSRGIAFDNKATDAELQALLVSAQNRVAKTFNFAGGRGKIELAFNSAKEDEPAQILICEEIGQDPWSGEGISAKDIVEALNAITPKTRPLDFLTNSPGGSVSEGTSIRNVLNKWEGRITNTIIGIAASTASWCIPADEVRAYKSSQMFLHKSWGCVMGNADDARAAAAYLDTTDGQIAEMLAEQSGKEPSAMLDLMSKESLLTGQQAKDIGLVDTLIDGDAKNQFTPDQLNTMRQKLAALNSLRSAPGTSPGQGERKAADNTHNQQDTIMNKTEMLALLNKWGVTVPQDATDEQIKNLVAAGKPAATPPAPANALSAEDQKLLTDLRNQVTESRRKDIRNRVQKLASAEGGHRIPVNEIDNWVETAFAAADGPNGNPILANLEKLPAATLGVDPINSAPAEITGESFADVQRGIIANSTGFRRQFLGAKASNEITPATLKDIGVRAMKSANDISKHKNMLVTMFNSNTIDADLQRQVILQDMLEAYALNLLPLDAFTVRYENVPLQGTDKVTVPYFPLQATASTSFVKGTGYTTISDWIENSRSVTVGGDGDAATNGSNATAGTAKDRLFQRIDFTSYDMRRQPYLNVTKLAQQAANKLGVDVVSQIYSRVIVVGNFGAAVKTVAPSLFTPDDVADLSEYADTAEWPPIARSLVLTNTYKTPLLKDATFKSYLSYGSTDPIRKAQIQEAYGFQDMYFVPNLAAKLATNTAGWINHKSAVLCAFAPIMPTPEVRNLLTTYDVIVEPRSGAVLEYRKFGNATTDSTQEVIESSFGAAKGVDAALKIIKSA